MPSAAPLVISDGLKESMREIAKEVYGANGHRRSVSDDSTSSTASKYSFVARVTASCIEPGCDNSPTGHEVVKFENVSNLDQLTDIMGRFFKKAQDGDAKARSNVSSCLWSESHRPQTVKVKFGGLNGNGWDDNGETVITNLNCDAILMMLADRKSQDSLSVTLVDCA